MNMFTVNFVWTFPLLSPTPSQRRTLLTTDLSWNCLSSFTPPQQSQYSLQPPSVPPKEYFFSWHGDFSVCGTLCDTATCRCKVIKFYFFYRTLLPFYYSVQIKNFFRKVQYDLSNLKFCLTIFEATKIELLVMIWNFLVKPLSPR